MKSLLNKNPHPHAEIIKAWADGREIEWRPTPEDMWESTSNPTWNENFEYRIREMDHELVIGYCYLIQDKKDMEVAIAFYCGDEKFNLWYDYQKVGAIDSNTIIIIKSLGNLLDD